jgi:hypothetical protein
VCFVDAYNGWAVGDSGLILRTRTGGVVTSIEKEGQEREQPVMYALFQNYPNPFNPTTTIIYELPKQSQVTVRLYDILGREVAMLVNEVKEPGRHTMQLDASNLASGVYLYRMQAGSFVNVKKLIVLK